MTDKKKTNQSDDLVADERDQIISDLTEALQRERADSINFRHYTIYTVLGQTNYFSCANMR